MTVFQETVEAVKVSYPKFSNACLSLAMRSYETGVQLTPRARSIANAVSERRMSQRTFSEHRAKSVSFRCRLSPADADAVKNGMAAEGIVSVQALVEMLLLEWSKKPHPGPVPRDAAQEGTPNENTSLRAAVYHARTVKTRRNTVKNAYVKLAAGLVPTMERLYKAGILRVGGCTNEVQCSADDFREMFADYEVEERDDELYRFELSTKVDGVRFFALANDR